MWLLFAFGSAFFAGVTAILAKIGIKNTDSNVATAIRSIVILIFSWIMVFIVGSFNTISSISPNTFIFLILSGLATGLSWLCYFKALQIGDVNKVTPIDKSSTVLTMILAFLVLNEPITLTKFIGMIGIGVGTYMMIVKKDLGDSSGVTKSDVETSIKGKSWLFYALLSAAFASLTSVLGKIGITGIESNLGTAIRTIVVLIMAWVVVFVTKKQGDVKNIDKTSWIFIILSGITTGLSWLCYYRALQDGPASIVVPIDKLSILFTISFSYIFLKEKLNTKSFIGLIIIIIGTLTLLI